MDPVVNICLTDPTWQSGMDNNDDYVLRIFDETNVFKLTRNGDMTIFGMMDVGLGWGNKLTRSMFTMSLMQLQGMRR